MPKMIRAVCVTAVAAVLAVAGSVVVAGQSGTDTLAEPSWNSISVNSEPSWD